MSDSRDEALTAVTVTVGEDHLEELPAVVERLRAAGMAVSHTLDAVGSVTGEAPASRLRELERVEGVEAVERSREFRLPPPDSPIQ